MGEERLDIFVHEGEAGYASTARSMAGPSGIPGMGGGPAVSGGMTQAPQNIASIANLTKRFLPILAGAAGILAVVKNSQVIMSITSAVGKMVMTIIDILLMPLVPILIPVLKLLMDTMPIFVTISDLLNKILTPLADVLKLLTDKIVDIIDPINKFFKGELSFWDMIETVMNEIFFKGELSFWDLIERALGGGITGTGKDKSSFAFEERMGIWMGENPTEEETLGARISAKFEKWLGPPSSDDETMFSRIDRRLAQRIGVDPDQPFWKSIDEAIAKWIGADPDQPFWKSIDEAIAKWIGVDPDQPFWKGIEKVITKWLGMDPEESFWNGVKEKIAGYFTGSFVPFWNNVASEIKQFWTGKFVPFWDNVWFEIKSYWTGKFVPFWDDVASRIQEFFWGKVKTFWEYVSEAVANFFTGARPEASISSHQAGISYVPQTGLALLHRGERVVSASTNYNNSRSVILYSNINISGSAPTDLATSLKLIFLDDLNKQLRRI